MGSFSIDTHQSNWAHLKYLVSTCKTNIYETYAENIWWKVERGRQKRIHYTSFWKIHIKCSVINTLQKYFLLPFLRTPARPFHFLSFYTSHYFYFFTKCPFGSLFFLAHASDHRVNSFLLWITWTLYRNIAIVHNTRVHTICQILEHVTAIFCIFKMG